MSGKSNLCHSFTESWSYQTMIRQVMPDGLSIGNITKYSATTSKHQTKARVHGCNILLDRVPIGSGSLRAIAEERGLLHSLETEVKRAVLEGRRN